MKRVVVGFTFLVLFFFSTSASGQSSCEHGLGIQVGVLNYYHPILPNGDALHVSSSLSGQLSYSFKCNVSDAFGVAAYPAVGIVSYVKTPFKDLNGGHYHFPAMAEFSPLIGSKRMVVLGAGASVFGFALGDWKTRMYFAPQLAAGFKFPGEEQRFHLRLGVSLTNIASEDQAGSDLPYRGRYLNTTLACYYRIGK